MSDDDDDDAVRLTVVPNALEAELVCGLLRADGITCTHRITNLGFGSGGELPASGGGAREVLVHAANLERARVLLAHAEEDPGE